MKDRKTPNAEQPLNHYYHPQHCGLISTESNTTQRQTTQNRRLSNALLLRIPRFNANFHSIIEDRSTTLQLHAKEIPVRFPGLFTMKSLCAECPRTENAIIPRIGSESQVAVAHKIQPGGPTLPKISTHGGIAPIGKEYRSAVYAVLPSRQRFDRTGW